MDGLFAGAEHVMVDLVDVPVGGDIESLIAAEIGELETEFGAPVTLGRELHADQPTFRLQADPTVSTPYLEFDGVRRLTATGPDLHGAVAAMSLIRTLRRLGGDAQRLAPTPVESLDEAVERLVAEVATTWPSFERTGLDWHALVGRHLGVIDPTDPVPALQRCVAELGDGHTNVHARVDVAALPYSARYDGHVVRIVDVPAGTAADIAGVRRGDVLLDVDLASIVGRVGAPRHVLPWLIGRRALSGPVGVEREWRVRTAGGSTVAFTDTPGASTWPDPLEVAVRASGTGYLRIRRWATDDIEPLDVAIDRLRGCDRLIVDLRGNAGGSLVAANDFRRRFVPRRAVTGGVRYSVGDGSLSQRYPIDDEPREVGRWGRPVRFVTDALTYSASEDAILGLNQFDHVQVVGERSGGGSGRPRSIPLWGTALLTVSTALTFDPRGRCVEGAGIAVDRRIVGEAVIDVVDTGW